MSNENPMPFSSVEERKKEETMPDKEKLSSALIAIACLTFFPVVYIIGRSIVNWLA
ncbi:MAG: hypothetical protein HRU41_03765 [Saprospiraceae bacterium]|nr:hypothetical protein [Saprospiraceae bacterium]